MNIDGVLFISCFLPVVLTLYWLIPKDTGRNILLLTAGLVFYAFGSLSGLGLLVGAAAFNYIMGRLIQRRKAPNLFCVIAVAADLIFLGVFKYLDFAVTEVLGLPAVELGIAAPLGISFFIFKCISYIVDTYRDRGQGTKDPLAFLLYISFFPQVMAGPISRFSQFRSQLSERSRDAERISRGIRRFVVGLAKKLILAGTLGAAADKIFGLDAGIVDIRLAWLGAIAYMLQIYFDFSGYSDMAIGLGNAFGMDTPENFQYPYIANSVTDFWRRWHISLSSWFRDYLYIPLGGNRKGKLRTALNKCIVFAFCGIWHGAAWTFVLWGLWHGLFSALESLKVIRIQKGRVLSRVYTLLVVCLGFVMFRAGDLAQGFHMIGAMFTGFGLTVPGTVALHGILTGETVAVLVLGAVLSLPVVPWIRSKIQGKWLEPVSYAACVLLYGICLMALASGGFTPFIYAQF